MNLPNALTLFRIFLVPLLVVALLSPPWAFRDRHGAFLELSVYDELLAVGIFLVAAVSDWLDGFLARRRNQVTTLGTLLDPIADKLLTTGAFIALVELDLAPAWMVVVIVGREFIVSGLRSVLATHGIALGASRWGKWKTTSQVVAIPLLILTHSIRRLTSVDWLGVVALWVSMLLALGSGATYLAGFLRRLPELDGRRERDLRPPRGEDAA